jgi:hypothetical protein
MQKPWEPAPRGSAFFQPAGKPAYFSGLFSVSEQLNLELLARP